MSTTLFLSHSHHDQKSAMILRETLRMVSSGHLDIWYSSDSAAGGGLQPGEWDRQVRSRLAETKAVIALMTPRSVSNLWVLFECGMGEALGGLVIPICLGLGSMSDLPSPLTRYQAYQLSDYASLRTLVSKLFKMHGLEFFEEVAGPTLRQAVQRFTETIALGPQDAKPPIDLGEAVNLIKNHIDQRLLGSAAAGLGRDSSEFVPYNVVLKQPARFLSAASSAGAIDLVLAIQKETTVQDVLDNIYFALAEHLQPFTYLEKWILRERQMQRYLVVREIGDLIPASCVFSPASAWEIVVLQKPYTPRDSRDTVRWYRSEP